MYSDNQLLDLELQLNKGGWSLETQRLVLENMKGGFNSFPNKEAIKICDEMENQSRQ